MIDFNKKMIDFNEKMNEFDKEMIDCKKKEKVALAIPRGLASREQRDANPRRMAQANGQERPGLKNRNKTHRPFRVGGRPALQPRDANPRRKTQHLKQEKRLILIRKKLIMIRKMMDLNRKMIVIRK